MPSGVCPLCGAGNACAMAGGGGTCRPCWCVAASFSAELLQRVPPATRGRACICAACAAAPGASGQRPPAMSSRFRPVALEHASRLINHGPTVLVTSAADDNVELQTIHHLGRGNFVRAGGVLRAKHRSPA